MCLVYHNEKISLKQPLHFYMFGMVLDSFFHKAKTAAGGIGPPAAGAGRSSGLAQKAPWIFGKDDRTVGPGTFNAETAKDHGLALHRLIRLWSWRPTPRCYRPMLNRKCWTGTRLLAPFLIPQLRRGMCVQQHNKTNLTNVNLTLAAPFLYV